MDPEFWRQRWKENRIGFHQHEVNPYLIRYWPGLELAPGSRIYVPLCGKSADMCWLSEQGYRVIGVDISAIAIRAFFSENGLQASRIPGEQATHGSSEQIDLICADFFELGREDIGRIGGFYDRAALIALPAKTRQHYASRLSELTDTGTTGLLVSLDYGQERMEGPPFSVSEDELRQLFTDRFTIERLHSEDVIETRPRFRDRGLDRLIENVFQLRRR